VGQPYIYIHMYILYTYRYTDICYLRAASSRAASVEAGRPPSLVNSSMRARGKATCCDCNTEGKAGGSEVITGLARGVNPLCEREGVFRELKYTHTHAQASDTR